jgi:NifU-like protein involved in Fe-S cluster formation
MKYSESTRRYFEHPVNAGVLSGPDVFRGSAGDREQGTWVQFDVQVQSGTLQAVRFLAFACPHTIAVSAWLAENSEGTALKAAMIESVQALRERFAVPVEKLGRLIILEDAWLAATTRAIDSADQRPHLS